MPAYSRGERPRLHKLSLCRLDLVAPRRSYRDMTLDPSVNSKTLQALIEGLSHPEAPQDREGKPGDPQLAALCQALIDRTIAPNEVIVDFGAGNGVLPEYLARVWPQSKPMPEYWAIDLPEMLEKLSLPSRIHNNSKKYNIEEFRSSVFARESSRISMIIIRNTLHELNIITTAKLFEIMLKFMNSTCLLYIQDMGRLTKPERGNVAWTRDLLEECLTEIGFDVRGFTLFGRSGTPWFALLCQKRQHSSSVDCLISIARRRAAQLENIAATLKDTLKYWDKTDELLLLQHEYSSLAIQLNEAHWIPSPRYHEPILSAMRIPIKAMNDQQLDYACVVPDSVSVRCGLIAFISSKNLLDFPKLLSASTEQIAFGGYSNRPLFLNERNIIALETAIRAGTRVSVMVIDPASDSARMRAEEPIYDDPAHFFADIQHTIAEGRKFFERICKTLGEEIANERFSLRSSKRIPRTSYFIVDDTCYLSFYSISLTGSAAPCFVFRRLPGVANNYFHVVQKDFSHLFSEATTLIGNTL